MTNYRYHRLRAESDNWRTDFPKIFECIELRLYTGLNQTGTEFATLGTAIESGHYNTNTANNVLDNNNTTAWIGEIYSLSWIGIDSGVGNAYKCLSFSIKIRYYNGHMGIPKTFAFECSNDGIYWIPAANNIFTSTDNTADTWYYYNVTLPNENIMYNPIIPSMTIY